MTAAGNDQAVTEAALWMFSTAVQGSPSLQASSVSALPDLVRLLDAGESPLSSLLHHHAQHFEQPMQCGYASWLLHL